MERKYICQQCGTAIIIHHAGRPAMYCPDCKLKAFKERYTGRYDHKYYIAHPRLTHHKINYRELAMLNKGTKCENCGEAATLIHVHHIDGKRENNDLNNLKVLCYKCHLKTHNMVNLNVENIIELRKQGLTLKDIGNHFGLSKQRIQQLLNKNGITYHKKETICILCGKEILRAHKYCPECLYKVHHQTVTCLNCGKIFDRIKSNCCNKHIFCSKQCQGQYLAKHRRPRKSAVKESIK